MNHGNGSFERFAAPGVSFLYPRAPFLYRKFAKGVSVFMWRNHSFLASSGQTVRRFLYTGAGFVSLVFFNLRGLSADKPTCSPGQCKPNPPDISILGSELSLTVGNVMAHPGQSFALPISWIEGSIPAVAMQFDVMIPPGMTVTAVNAGDAAMAAGKSVQSNRIDNRRRIVVLGINQNPIKTGQIAILTMDSLPSSPVGNYMVTLSSMSIVDESSHDILVTGWSGQISLTKGHKK